MSNHESTWIFQKVKSMSANLISLKFEGRVKKAVQNVSRANEPRDQPTGTHSYSYRVDFFFFSFFFCFFSLSRCFSTRLRNTPLLTYALEIVHIGNRDEWGQLTVQWLITLCSEWFLSIAGQKVSWIFNFSYLWGGKSRSWHGQMDFKKIDDWINWFT